MTFEENIKLFKSGLLPEIAGRLEETMADMYDIMIDLNRHMEASSPEENNLTPAGTNEVAAIYRMLSDACAVWESHGDDFLKSAGVD